MRQWVLGIVVLQLLSALFLYYPVWRLSLWLGLAPAAAMSLGAIAFVSQLVVRLLLRRDGNRFTRLLRISADFLLGLSPLLLATVICAEILLVTTGLAVQWAALSALMLSLLIGLWGVKKASLPEVVPVTLRSPKLTSPLRFVQISDVHIGSRSSRFLRHIVDQVNDLQPDFLCITGDFIDERNISTERLAALRDVVVPIYFCTGNHEHYEDLSDILERLEELGVVILRGERIERHGIQIVGFDDQSDPDFLQEALPTLGLRDDLFSLLLFHRPHGFVHAAANGIDLKISGHTHKGQIRPFDLLVRMQFKYMSGLYQQGDAYLYVNEGTGTWGPTMRIGTRSEITLFEISPVVNEALSCDQQEKVSN